MERRVAFLLRTERTMSSNRDAWWLRGSDKCARWMVDGLCRQVDPDLFFPEMGDNTTAKAQKVCANCPVMDKCLDYALAHPGITGVWGGTSEKERARMRRMAAA